MLPEATTEPDIDTQLAELMKETSSGAPAPAPAASTLPAVGTQAPPAASPAEPEKPVEEDPLLKALEAEEEPKKEEPAKEPVLTAEQQKIFAEIPSAEAATALRQTAENYRNFTGALAEGRFDDVFGMIQAWNPAILEGLYEHVYQQKMKTDEWTDRYIEESKGNGGQHKTLTALQRQVAELQAQVRSKETAKSQQTSQEQAAERDRQAYATYSKNVGDLVAKYAPEGDREFIIAAIDKKVGGDKKVLDAVRGGDPKAAVPIAKEVLRKYLTRDKAVKESEAAKLEVQSQKKAPLGGGAGGPDPGLPEDVRQVPKGQEDSWVDASLGKLIAKFKK